MKNKVILLYEIRLRFGHAISITKGKDFFAFIIDETIIQIGNQIMVMDLYRTSS
jgi:hypothetical protein